MKYLLGILLVFGMGLGFGQALAQDENTEEQAGEENTPLSITIRPDYDKFDGTFNDGTARDASRIENRTGCPRDQILSCDITGKFWNKSDKINATVAAFAYEKSQEDWDGPSLGMLMGGRYAKLPDYLVLASLGIDPGLDPLDPYPQVTGQMYGSLWFADTMNLGDRMAGPIMLARNSKNWVKRYNGKRGICIGVC